MDVGERPDAPLEQALDRREAERRALVVERLGDAPGDRVVVRDAEDQRLLAVEQAHAVLPRASVAEPTIGPCPEPPAEPTCAPRSTASARSSSTPTACSCIAGAPIAGSPEALVELRRRGIPYRVVTNFSSAHRSSLAAAFGKATGLDVDGGRDHHRGLRGGRLHGEPPRRQADPRAGRARRAAGVGGPGGRRARRGGRSLRAGRGGRHRRRGRRPVVPQPRHRVPPAPQRRRVRGHAPQPVVDDAEGLHARCRRARRGPRVRARAARRDLRQALAGRVPAGRSTSCARSSSRPTGAAALASVPPTWRWSATTRGPTSPPRAAWACAASSC